MTKKILCIDDIPECEIGDTTLRKCMNSLFKGRYDVLFEKKPQKAYETIKKDVDIKLIFLDVDFEGDPLGPEIADVVKSLNPELPVIVLTTIDRHGEKVRFGKKTNVMKYVTKQELGRDIFRTRVSNLAEGLIEDPHNKYWIIGFDDERETLRLSNPKRGFEKVFGLPSKVRVKIKFLLYACIERPNECLQSIEMRGFVDSATDSYAKYINNVVYEVNNTVREETEWMTWGILDSQSCCKSAVKLVIGKVEDRTKSTGAVSIHTEEYHELKAEIEELKKRIIRMEEGIKNK